MSDFSNRPFATGSLVGLRAFDTDPDGTLRGPTYPHAFENGVNEADCFEFFGAVQWQLARSLGWSGWFTADPPARKSMRSRLDHHTVGAVGCTCGFYAYTDGSNQYANAARVTAIVEGFGVCTVGDRGFRASKARLVALVDPRPRNRVGIGWWGFLTAWTAINSVLLASDRNWWAAGGCLVLAVLDGLMLLQTWRPRSPIRRRFKAVRAKHPDVPVYRTQAAALAAHPLGPKGGAA